MLKRKTVSRYNPGEYSYNQGYNDGLDAAEEWHNKQVEEGNLLEISPTKIKTAEDVVRLISDVIDVLAYKKLECFNKCPLHEYCESHEDCNCEETIMKYCADNFLK